MATDLDIAEQLLAAAKAAGADQADAMVVEETSLGIGVADGKLEEAERSEGRDAGLRVLIGGKQACVSGSDTSPDALRAMADRAVALAQEAPDDPHAGLADASLIGGHVDPASLDLADPSGALGPETLEEMALAAEAAAMAIEGVSQVEQASASYGASHITIAQSNGFSGAYPRTTTGVGVSAIAGEGLGRERD
ncbi:MAG: DNA gyrase modulator, partial [Pseudomonadota bacterium]